MRIGFISDVHGNLEALTSVLEILKNKNIDRINGLGDFVGYMVNPNECVSLVKQFKCVMGNHDCASFDVDQILSFNTRAKEAMEWTRNELTKENIAFLKSLPDNKIYIEEDYSIAHGALNDRFKYIEDEMYARINLKLLETQVLFVGHTHIPVIWKGVKKYYNHLPHNYRYQVEEIDVYDKMTFKLNPEEKYIINVGSIGQPRDNNNLGSFVIFDTEKKVVEFHRFDYPRNITVQKMIELNRPRRLYERIIQGI
ncbi:metallophosphoesterase family protein [Alkaliphilus sp. B6464]|uniref:metallophosphoesterase family protein n=1 Tax=Alkaliphilus sp. B6464 TaxID=2731219 RepID=UPI001BA71263|nr:metallophosphoesterase family protein [Alkaliphilus sp. B6464]QUH21894.1 metallophosphoesterase family protein [Alkaliphilus sp. B6464]